MSAKEKIVPVKPLMLVGEVDPDMTLKVMNYLSYIKTNPTDIIQVILSTDGGSVADALGIYDMLLMQDLDVHITCVGQCMSAGTIILGAGDFRSATYNTQFLVHYGNAGSDSEDTAKHNKEVHDQTKRIMVDYTGNSMRTVTKWHKQQKYFMAIDAIDLGFIHEIE